MSKLIPTGFNVNPLGGAVGESDLLCRYFPEECFVDFLENSSLWFSRINTWKINDPLEGLVVSAIGDELGRPFKNNSMRDFLVARTELYIRSSFACCFMLYDHKDHKHMWSEFCPTGRGAMIVIKARSLAKAANESGRKFSKHIRKIRYIDATERQTLKITDIDHATVSGDSEYLDPRISWFLKDEKFKAEQEVRSVLFPGSFDRSLLRWFAGYRNLVWEVHSMQPKTDKIPKGQTWLSGGNEGNTFWLIKMSDDDLAALTEAISSKYSLTFPTLEQEPGIKIPFDIGSIEKIVIHPGMMQESISGNHLWATIKKFELSTRTRVGHLEASCG